jgi:hypothetical protein
VRKAIGRDQLSAFALQREADTFFWFSSDLGIGVGDLFSAFVIRVHEGGRLREYDRERATSQEVARKQS